MFFFISFPPDFLAQTLFFFNTYNTSKNEMKKDIYCIFIHAELQLRTKADGEGDAEQIREQPETKYK